MTVQTFLTWVADHSTFTVPIICENEADLFGEGHIRECVRRRLVVEQVAFNLENAWTYRLTDTGWFELGRTKPPSLYHRLFGLFSRPKQRGRSGTPRSR